MVHHLHPELCCYLPASSVELPDEGCTTKVALLHLAGLGVVPGQHRRVEDKATSRRHHPLSVPDAVCVVQHPGLEHFERQFWASQQRRLISTHPGYIPQHGADDNQVGRVGRVGLPDSHTLVNAGLVVELAPLVEWPAGVDPGDVGGQQPQGARGGAAGVDDAAAHVGGAEWIRAVGRRRLPEGPGGGGGRAATGVAAVEERRAQDDGPHCPAHMLAEVLQDVAIH